MRHVADSQGRHAFALALTIASLAVACGDSSAPAVAVDSGPSDLGTSKDVPAAVDTAAVMDTPAPTDLPAVVDVASADVTAPDVVATDAGSSVDAAPDAAPDVITDTGPTCPTGQRLCAGTCRDPQRDVENCGACGNTCAAGQVCMMGVCRTTCATGQNLCGTTCRDLLTDRANCGSCDTACASGEICTSGACVLSCPMGQVACGGGCRNLQTDASHCGMCGHGCMAANASPTCVMGACGIAACNAGFGNCDINGENGCETDVRSSVTHCGHCGNACRTGEVCAGGTCVYTVPRSCREIQRGIPTAVSGTFTIDPDGSGGNAPFAVYCDMSTDGGGWTLIGRIGEAAPPSARGDFRSDRNAASLVTAATPTSSEFSTFDLARFNAYSSVWSVRAVVDTATNGTHFQSTYYRPRGGAAITLGTAGQNWLDTSTAAAMEYLTRSTNIGQNNARYLPVQGFDRTSATIALFVYRRGTSGDPCLDATGENQLCHAPAGGITNEPGLNGTYTAAFSNNDGVAHTWGRRGTYWLRDSLCSPNTGDCDNDASNGCEAQVRNDALNCGACGRVCTMGTICDLGTCRRPYPRTCNELHTSDPSATNGTQTIDPDGPGGIDPFTVYCDMTLDGGGWTLLGAGAWWMSTVDAVLAPGPSNALLSDARRSAIIAASARLYRNGSTSAGRQYIEDMGADFGPAQPTGGRHYWRTASTSVRCATSYAAVMSGALITTTTREMTCDPTGVGSHTCGVTSGWILFHDLDTYNISGRHPCAFGTGGTPTGRALGDLWVR